MYFAFFFQASKLAKMEDKLARATVVAASAAECWRLENEYWVGNVETQYGLRTREAQHFKIYHCASNVVRRRDKTLPKLELAATEERILIPQDLADKVLRDSSRRWSEREAKRRMVLEVQTLLVVSWWSQEIIVFSVRRIRRLRFILLRFFDSSDLIVRLFAEEMRLKVKSYREKHSRLLAAQK